MPGNWNASLAELGHDDGMPDLCWDDVKEWFDPDLNLPLPDVYVPDTRIEDWQTVVDLVRSKGWAYQYEVGGRVARLPGRIEDMLARPDNETIELKVWPTPGVLAIFRLYAVEQIDFDVDLRELQGQDRLDVLCSFLRVIGRRLRKPVVMTPEGSPDFAMLGYDVDTDRVVMLAKP